MNKVLLCCMPFGPADWPHLGLSLLKAELEGAGIGCDVRYFSMDFAYQIGKSFYVSLAEDDPSYKTLAGEWIFTPALHGWEALKTEDYLTAAQAREPEYFTEALIKRVVDAQARAALFLDDCLEDLDWESYAIIGFSSTTQQQNASLALAKQVKDRWPDKQIIFGGSNVEGEMGLTILQLYDFVNYVCLGEGDRLLITLASRLHTKKGRQVIPGLAYRNNGRIYSSEVQPLSSAELDGLPFPDFDDFFRQHLAVFGDQGWRGDLPFETSRGCWWGERESCTFCGSSEQWLRHRQKSPRRILDEIDHLVERYQPNALFANDLTTPRAPSRFLTELAGRRPGLKLLYQLRAGTGKAQLEQMKQAGVDFVLIGIESLSTPILTLMNKGITMLTNIQTLKWCRELGIKVMWSILYGFPMEQASAYMAIADLIPALVHLEPPSFITPINLLRFSPHFNTPERYGLTNIRPAVFFEHIYPTASCDELSKLARFFDFDPADGHDPETYIRPTREAVDRWRADFSTSILTYMDDGKTLKLFDTRPQAKREVHYLRGLVRALYLFCDQRRGIRGLHRRFAPEEEGEGAVERILDQLINEGLMISEDQAFLSLGVDISRHIRPDQRGQLSDQLYLSLSHGLMGTQPRTVEEEDA